MFYFPNEQSMTTTGIKHSHLQYLHLLWPVLQSGAAVEHNDIILTLGLLSKQHIAHSPIGISHISLENTQSKYPVLH